jgi:hypothetical protein
VWENEFCISAKRYLLILTNFGRKEMDFEYF